MNIIIVVIIINSVRIIHDLSVLLISSIVVLILPMGRLAGRRHLPAAPSHSSKQLNIANK